MCQYFGPSLIQGPCQVHIDPLLQITVLIRPLLFMGSAGPPTTSIVLLASSAVATGCLEFVLQKLISAPILGLGTG
jgi:hypothetical protein